MPRQQFFSRGQKTDRSIEPCAAVQVCACISAVEAYCARRGLFLWMTPCSLWMVEPFCVLPSMQKLCLRSRHGSVLVVSMHICSTHSFVGLHIHVVASHCHLGALWKYVEQVMWATSYLICAVNNKGPHDLNFDIYISCHSVYYLGAVRKNL